MTALDLEALRAAPLRTDPFPFFIVPGFLKAEARQAIHNDFPTIELPGSLPANTLNYGPAFQSLLDELHGPALTAAMGEKLGVDLSNRPTMITVRGRARLKDGQIHTDSRDKLVTVLIYMNPSWESDAGRLRLLRKPDDLEDYVDEVPPDEGTLLAFLNTENSWHGHKPVEGPRRAIQLNWVQNSGVVMREKVRHTISARFKALKRAVGLA